VTQVGAHTLHVHDQLTLALLPVASFCSGHVFFTQQLPKRLVRAPCLRRTRWRGTHAHRLQRLPMVRPQSSHIYW
jgi:hypothetical protein